MRKKNHFILENSSAEILLIAIEPEGFVYELRQGESVHITDAYVEEPVTLHINRLEADKIDWLNTDKTVVAVWPGDGDVTIEHDGVNLLDLI